MAGRLGHVTSFARRRLTLGYREARLLSDLPIGRSGEIVRGHEFHYSSLVEAGSDAPLVTLSDARGASIGPAGGRRGRVMGTFFHAIAGEREPSRSKFSFVVPGALQREAMLRRSEPRGSESFPRGSGFRFAPARRSCQPLWFESQSLLLSPKTTAMAGSGSLARAAGVDIEGGEKAASSACPS